MPPGTRLPLPYRHVLSLVSLFLSHRKLLPLRYLFARLRCASPFDGGQRDHFLSNFSFFLFLKHDIDPPIENPS